ncbi:MAG: NACHT domain-containing protein [Aestuariivita sp.]|nr:NACHT domain-containing protein [Aestuariivita sp.]
MATIFSSQDIKLLGYKLAEKSEEHSDYDIYDATSKMGIDDVKTRFIYLKTRCTLEGAKKVALERGQVKRVCVVKAKSSSLKIDRLESIFGKGTRICFQDELVWEALRDSFDDYLENLENRLPEEKHFIEPRSSETDVGEQLFDILRDHLIGRSNKIGDRRLLVLSANAGVGKTTLARQLTHKLVGEIRRSSSRTIPIYIESQHWQKLRIESIDSLWEVIDNSLRSLSSSHMRLNEELFNHAIQQGYFTFIFDGFDELCTSSKMSSFYPSLLLDQLSNVVGSNNSVARVLLTTRTMFWKSQVSNAPENTVVWPLDAFNKQEVYKYFLRVFGQKSPHLTKAKQVYNSLVSEALPKEKTGSVRDQFVNLPLIAKMIVDYVNNGGSTLYSSSSQPNLMKFLYAICEREIHRQNLKTPAHFQMNSFLDMAVEIGEFGEEPRFTIEDLEYAQDGFVKEDLVTLTDHALLELDRNSSKYIFRYNFLVPFLRASEISKWITKDMKDDNWNSENRLISLVKEIVDGKEYVLEQIPNFLEETDIAKVIKNGEELSKSCNKGSQKDRYLSSSFFHIAQAISPNEDQMSKTERADKLFGQLFNISDDGNIDRTIDAWGFIGTINSLDLRNIRGLYTLVDESPVSR